MHTSLSLLASTALILLSPAFTPSLPSAATAAAPASRGTVRRASPAIFARAQQQEQLPLPAGPSAQSIGRQGLNATLQVTWGSSSVSRGVYSDVVAPLWQGDGTRPDDLTIEVPANFSGIPFDLSGQVGNSSYGLLFHFNESVASNQSASLLPFVAYINCDDGVLGASGSGTWSVPVNASATSDNGTTYDESAYSPYFNGTVAGNVSTPIDTNSTLAGNGTEAGNVPVDSGDNSTMSDSGMNATTPTMNVSAPLDLFQLAASLNAVAVVLYSESQASCVLSDNYTSPSLANYSRPLDIFTTIDQDQTQQLQSQFSNTDHVLFNSSAVQEALPQIGEAIINGTFFTPFLAANITMSNETSDNAGPVIGTFSSVAEQPTASSEPSNGQSTAGENAARALNAAGPASLVVAGLATLLAGLVTVL